MDQEVIKQEIKDLLNRMGLGGDVQDIEVSQGTTSRFCVRMRAHPLRPSSSARSAETETRREASGFVDGPDEDGRRISLTNMLIGEHGNNLAALEHIVKKIIKKKYGEEYHFTLDINDYRNKRLKDLTQDVKEAAGDVRRYARPVPLRPMTSFERRIVHLLLEEYPDITTESIGQEPDRRVVIKPFA